MNHKSHLKQLAAAGDIGRAIEELLEATEQNGQDSLQNDLIILSGRYRQQTDSKLRGLIDEQHYNIQMANIGQALLYYIGEYEPNGNYKYTPFTPTPDNTPPAVPAGPAVFLSYSHADKDLAGKIRAYLEKQRIQVIQDITHLQAGENIQDFIQRSVRESKATVSLISSKSLLSVWVAKESLNSFYATKLADQKFIPVFEDHAFFKRSFVDDALDKIDEEILEINGIIQRRLERGRNITDLQEELSRYTDLKHHLPMIVQRLKEHFSVNISGESFEAGMRKVLDAFG